MHTYRLAELLDMSLIQKLADSNFLATGIPMSIIDMFDASILIRAGWTDICMKFHRVCPASLQRCKDSDSVIKGKLVEGEVFRYKCKNGLWHMAIPIYVAGNHLATMFLTQFYFEGEVPKREYFIQQAREFGYDQESYLAALDKLPVFSLEKVEYILSYDKALVSFISGLAEQSLKVIETRKELAESEEKFRSLVNNINTAVCRTSPEGRYLQANPAMAKIFGYATPELLMETLAGDVYRDLGDRKRLFEALLAEGAVKDVEIPMKRKDGTPIWTSLSVTAQYDEQGAIKWVDSVLEDITERKRAEDELKKAHLLQKRALRFTEALLSAIPTPVFYKDREGKYLNCNHAFSDIMGVTPEQIRGKTVYELWPSEHAKVYHEKDLELMSNPVRQIYEFKVKDKDGVIHPVLYAKDVFRDENDKVAGLVGAFIDITEQKKAEEAIRTLNEELERKVEDRTRELSEANVKLKEVDRLKSMFLANMSHEIRTPMNGILGMAELLMDTRLDREQQEFVKAVTSSGEALLTIINDILDFSKIEAQKIELETINFNLRDSIGDTLHTLTFRAAGKGLELACDIPADVPDSVIGDPGRLRQIIINLVGNSIKFTDQGEVVLSVTPEWIKEGEAMLHFVITDTGIGIPPEKQSRIFEAFSQVDASTTRKYGGTGLGLTISARLVELMGGRIWVESERGKGSEFHFTVQLGLQKDRGVRYVPEKLENLEALPVLVVDDNATNRRILEEMLKHWHMAPVLTDNGATALQLLAAKQQQGKPFRLLLLDVNMPTMDGFELAERIKQEPDNSNLVIMVLTSSGQRGDAARCRELGISAYLTKPVKQSSLLDAIMTILGKTEPAEMQPPLVTQHMLREQQRRLRILLAEDNAVNQKIASSMLTKRGHTVVVAGNGKEVLADLEAQGGQLFDLILMDVQMPEMDGLEATAHIREKERTTKTHIPIIALTAHAMKGDRETCIAAGMDGYATKPLKAEELFKAINTLLSISST